MVAGGGFHSNWNHQLIKFEEQKRFGIYKQFCNYEKREINTFENFPCDFFFLQDIPVPIVPYFFFSNLDFILEKESFNLLIFFF